MQHPLIIAALLVLGLYATLKSGYLAALSHIALDAAYCPDTSREMARRMVAQGFIAAGWFGLAYGVWRLS